MYCTFTICGVFFEALQCLSVVLKPMIGIRFIKKKTTMKAVVAFLLTLLAATNAVELTPETWDDATAGKTVFIKFLAPW